MKKRKRIYPKGPCVNCHLYGKIIKDGLCYSCYQDRRVTLLLRPIINGFKPITKYNKYLFDLYILYIKRYRLSYSIKNQAKYLADRLEQTAINTLKGWHQVYCLSDAYVIYQPNSTAKSCAFIKIGKMLQELGVLPPPEDEYDRQIAFQLDHFETKKTIQLFINDLEKINIAKRTIIKYLYTFTKFYFWIYQNKKIKRLEDVSENIIEEYFNEISQEYTVKYIRDQYNCLKRFYCWAYNKQIISKNIIPKLLISREKEKINILDDEKKRKLFSFIKKTDSNPEQALMITLILFWGLKTIDLAQASLIPSQDFFQIKLRRRKTTKGKHYYNREEILKLPQNPRWLKGLQQRFYNQWIIQYGKAKKSYPHTPLFIHERGHYVNFLSTHTILNRFYKATEAACGHRIPIKIIKQTCGDIYSKSGDASILSTLGWSSQFAFHYTWLPREIWSK